MKHSGSSRLGAWPVAAILSGQTCLAPLAQEVNSAAARESYAQIAAGVDRIERIVDYVNAQVDASVYDVVSLAGRLGSSPSSDDLAQVGSRISGVSGSSCG